MTGADESRALELLADRATMGLDAEEQAELEALLGVRPDLDDESFELAAAAVELACMDVAEPLPSALRQRVLSQAEDFYGAPTEPSPSEASPKRGTTPERTADVASFPVPPSASARQNLGWLAAAAALVLAILGWLPERRSPVRDAAPPDPAVQRQAILAEVDVDLPWTATEDPAAAGASGGVLWSTARQEGYLRFRGLPVNDPTLEQYQLWIFDGEQDERYPIDGGVFDVDAPGEVWVPIDAKLRVRKPTLFAITIEKPGGVVVSSRERLVLLAQVG